MDNIYNNGTYLENNPSWHVEDSPWKAANILKMIRNNNIDPNLVCEIGCGAGEILIHLSKRLGQHVIFHGYEISKQAYDLCVQTNNDRVTYFLKDMLSSQDRDYYDLILIIDLIEHIKDYYGFIENIKSKGKYKIFHIPLDISARAIMHLATINRVRTSVGHIHYFIKDTALASLRDSGYNIIDYFYTYKPIQLKHTSIKSYLAKFPKKLLYMLNDDFFVRLLGGASLMVLAE